MKLQYSDLISSYPVLQPLESNVVKAVDMIEETIRQGGKLITMGNGGSSADAEHICGELQKGFVCKRPLAQSDRELFQHIDPAIPDQLQGGISAISLVTMHSTISAFNNDMDPAYVFGQQIWALAKPQDTILAISTSGNSKNVVNGLKVAKAMNIKTISLTGEKDSLCSEWSQLTIKAPHHITHKIQELHLPIYHAICIELENRLFDE
ncbi:MAG: SIS domain-containing protein [Halobacteriovoraceae bacterium]|nr:SIS domain-containing protein [Halobacteriovoraceae bacterium]